MSEPLFVMNSVSAGYPGNNFMNELSYTVHKGEFVSLIGQNGAGKSTLLKLLSGLHTQSVGEIFFSGRRIGDYSRRDIARMMSVVNHLQGDMPDFPVNLFMSFGRFPHSGPFGYDPGGDEVIEKTAEMCGIENLLNRSVRELSSGEFQLVQIARALVQNRETLLLDEPVSNMDYRHLTQILDILAGLNHSGTTVICSLHNVSVASDYSTRVTGIRDGAILFDGAPDDVVNAENMRGLFDSEFYCGRNPVTGRPLVLPVPGIVR